MIIDPSSTTKRRRIWRPVAAATAPLLVAALGVVGAEPAAATPPVPVAQAAARFLTGSAGALDLATLSGLVPALAASPDAGGSGLSPLSAETLNGLVAPLAGGGSLLGAGGVLGLGAVNQVASADPTGASRAAAGAVTDLGAIALGGPGAQAPVSLDATSLLDDVPAVGAALNKLTVTLDGIASTATQAAGANGAQSGTYAVSGGLATLGSPDLAGIPAAVTGALAPLQSALDGLGGANGGLASAVAGLPVVGQVTSLLGLGPTTSATVGSDLVGEVAPLLSQLNSADGLIGVDLVTGLITADLAGLVGGEGGLSGLPVGTDLLSADILETISGTVTALVADLVADIQDTVNDAINSAPVSLHSVSGVLTGLLPTGLDITADGTLQEVLAGTADTSAVLKLLGVPLALPGADLLTALSGPIGTDVVTGALPTFLGLLPAGTSLPVVGTLAPALDSVGSVLGMSVNNQSVLDGVFTQTALVTTLLPGNPLAVLGLASSSVGPNAGPPAAPAAPTASSLAPTSGSTAGGGTVTVTGTGFVAGATSVKVGSTTVPAGSVTVSSPTSLSFAMPARSAGAVGVHVVTAGGTSSALTYTYVAPVVPVDPPPAAPAPTATGLFPTGGPSAGGRSLTVTGTGFKPGATTVTIGGIAIPPASVRVTGTTRLTVTTPKRPAGKASVVVSTSAGKSAGRAYSYLAAPSLKSLTASTGSTAGGTLVTAAGSGFVPGNTAVRIGTRTLPAADVTVVSATQLKFTTPARSAGTAKVVVLTAGGTSGAKSFAYRTGRAVAPKALKLSAVKGSVTGGQNVTVTGSGFVPGSTSVRVGTTTVPAERVHVLLPTKLVVALPKRAAGRTDLRVVTAGGTSGKLAYTYAAPATPAAAAPAIKTPATKTATADPAPFVAGTGTAGSTVTVYVDGTRWCTATVSSAKSWSCAGTTAVLPGLHVLTARQHAAGRSPSPAATAVELTAR